MNNTTLNFDPNFGLDDSLELLQKLRGNEPAQPFEPEPLPELTGIALALRGKTEANSKTLQPNPLADEGIIASATPQTK